MCGQDFVWVIDNQPYFTLTNSEISGKYNFSRVTLT